MVALKTFLFENDFDDIKLMEQIVKAENMGNDDASEGEAIEPEFIAPTFSEADLEIARQTAFDSGKESGATEALSGIENTISQTLEAIVEKTSELFQQQSEFNEQIKIDALSLLNTVNQKLFPLVSEQINLDETLHFTKEILPTMLLEPRLTIRVPDNIAEPLKQKIKDFLEEQDYPGELIVNGSKDMSVGSCHVEWSSGSIEKDTELLVARIEERFLSAINSGEISESGKTEDSPTKDTEFIPESNDPSSVDQLTTDYKHENASTNYNTDTSEKFSTPEVHQEQGDQVDDGLENENGEGNANESEV